MSNDPRKHALRLRKSHEPDPEPPPDLAIGQRLWDAQSLARAAVAGLAVIAIFTLLWAMVSLLFTRVFPWATLILGFLVGLAVRRAGLGLSWPFPAAAAALALAGALLSSVIVSTAVVADELGTGLFDVLTTLGTTIPAYADRILTPAHVVYAVSAAAIAAFYSMRRLSRRQYLAFRLWLQTDPPR